MTFDQSGDQWLRDQLQCVFQGALLECSTLAEPGTVQAVVLTARLFLVVYELGHCTEQAPCGILGRLQFSATAMTFEQGLHLLEGTLVGQARYT